MPRAIKVTWKPWAKNSVNENAALTVGIATPAAQALASAANKQTPVMLAGILIHRVAA